MRCKACNEVLNGYGDEELCPNCIYASRDEWDANDVYDNSWKEAYEDLGDGNYIKNTKYTE